MNTPNNPDLKRAMRAQLTRNAANNAKTRAIFAKAVEAKAQANRTKHTNKAIFDTLSFWLIAIPAIIALAIIAVSPAYF